MRQIIWTCVVVWLGACEIPPDVKSQIACTTICTCFGQPDVEDCTNECIEEGDLGQLPEDCFECIQTHANQCSTLEEDCEAICARPEPPVEDL
ncbi:MAG: hypothetical protein M4D80_10260 [Myxococcota bacterium]|nr:hypothetical protein [Deltaproteobacteria bacterium]MDQ3335538.1 hypothetical protein [Myxococcota bacterium]